MVTVLLLAGSNEYVADGTTVEKFVPSVLPVMANVCVRAPQLATGS